MSLKRSLETKIPPPVYGLLTALLIWWLNHQLPGLKLISEIAQYIGLVLIATGFIIELLALRLFYRNRTTPNPFSPAKADKIVVTGLYQYTRNPMYLGLLISLTGWAIYLGNLLAFICLPLFVLILNKMQIQPEERILKEKFGQPYKDYLARVRRWL